MPHSISFHDLTHVLKWVPAQWVVCHSMPWRKQQNRASDWPTWQLRTKHNNARVEGVVRRVRHSYKETHTYTYTSDHTHREKDSHTSTNQAQKRTEPFRVWPTRVKKKNTEYMRDREVVPKCSREPGRRLPEARGHKTEVAECLTEGSAKRIRKRKSVGQLIA